MTVEIRTGDLFDSGAQMLVNPVNCVGVMGAGLAKQFKQRHPDMFARYQVLCHNGHIRPGQVMVDAVDHYLVANAATKEHWRDPSRMEWVLAALAALNTYTTSHEVASVAMPLLGAGLGGLDPVEVYRLTLGHLSGWPEEVHVALYVPEALT